MKRMTRKEMVLAVYDREAMGEVSAHEIAVINEALMDEFGEGGIMSPAEMARVFAEEDIPVRFDQVLVMRSPNERYHRRFVEVLRCESLTATEAAIRGIDDLCRSYRKQNDRTGLRLAREAVLSAKRRAQELAEHELTDASQRVVYSEMAQWFTLWLQTPDVFETWLELRKASAEFKRLFAH